MSMGGKKPRCLVTGGAGFLGQHIVTQLLQRGHYDVVIFDIRATDDQRVSCIVGDLRKPEQVGDHTTPSATWCCLPWVESSWLVITLSRSLDVSTIITPSEHVMYEDHARNAHHRLTCDHGLTSLSDAV